MAKYMKKPVVVEAFQMTKELADKPMDWPAWLKTAFYEPKIDCALKVDKDQAPFMFCLNAEGSMLINPNDYIIYDLDNGLYSYIPDVFEALFEKIENVKITKRKKPEVKKEKKSKQQFLFFDTETSGFISKSKSFDDPDQAWCVQIGAILSTEDEILKELNIIIKANGREINYHAQKIHGISVEQADAEGLDEFDAISQFADLMIDNPILVCHNFDFDWAYVYQMMQRHLDKMTDEHRSVFYRDLPHICTMKDPKVKKYVKAKNIRGAIKWPKLMELYEKIRDDYEVEFSKTWNYTFTDDDAHDAMADIVATRNCFFELIRKGILTI